MCKITSSGLNNGITIVSNRFIDEYLADASGRDLKVYLYLLRYSYVPEADISLSNMAEILDETPNKILTALKSWQKLGLLDFTLDENKEIKRIWMADVNTVADSKNREIADDETQTDRVAKPGKTTVQKESVKSEESAITKETSVADEAPITLLPAPPVKEMVFPHYSPEQINLISDDEHFKGLVGIVERYLAPKTMTYKDISTLAGIYEGYGFSDEIICHLYDYCYSKGNCNHRYVEKVATNWAEKNIRTIEQAQFEEQFHNKMKNDIRKALGMSKGFANTHLNSIEKWVYEYKLPNDVIITACDRAAMAEVDKPFAYAAKIIEEWYKNGIKTVD
ncbi:MAG: DnaD domain protein, partial [Lachnospiraceae bacterium]|nr:DnaD domain protein [Lachnospiraceae bacterium]